VELVALALQGIFKVLVITLLCIILHAYRESNQLRKDILNQQKIFNSRIIILQSIHPKTHYKDNLKLAKKITKALEGNVGG